jgi:hypothetical protein
MFHHATVTIMPIRKIKPKKHIDTDDLAHLELVPVTIQGTEVRRDSPQNEQRNRNPMFAEHQKAVVSRDKENLHGRVALASSVRKHSTNSRNWRVAIVLLLLLALTSIYFELVG